MERIFSLAGKNSHKKKITLVAYNGFYFDFVIIKSELMFYSLNLPNLGLLDPLYYLYKNHFKKIYGTLKLQNVVEIIDNQHKS